MNEVLKAIHDRRSIRAYKPELPTEADIRAVMQAGIEAPTGRNSQSVIVLAITDRSIRDSYSRANAAVMGTDTDPFYGAPVILAVLVNKSAPCAAYDGPIALENMMLAAHSLGLGSCWIHRAKQVFEKDEWRQLLAKLGIEGEYEGVGNLALGYIDGDYPPEKAKNKGRMFFI